MSAPIQSTAGEPPSSPYLRRLLRLCWVFFRTGATTFGGGYAMIPVIERDMVERERWLTHEEMFQMVAIGEATPGVISVNIATFVGYRVCGAWGGIAATFALAFPAFLVIVVIALFYSALHENAWIAAALAGIRAGAIALIATALVRMAMRIEPTALNLLIIAAAILGIGLFKLSAILLILIGLLGGIAAHALANRKRSDSCPK